VEIHEEFEVLRVDAAGQNVSWTIVITTLNRSTLLKRAIESAIAQTEPCEIVVVDDGSTDDTRDMVARYAQIIYLRNPTRLGHAAAANLGIKTAKGTWIKFLDDDDYLSPECLRAMTQAISKAKCNGYDPKVVTCASTNVAIDKTTIGKTPTLPIQTPAVIGRDDLLPLMMLDQIPLGTPVQVAHERAAAIALGGWNEQRSIDRLNGDESEFWIRLAQAGDMLFLPQTLVFRTIWSGNESVTSSERLGISLDLKLTIARQMNKGKASEARVPPAIVHYLCLHWGLVALRDRKILCGIGLVLRGMFDPASYRYIWRRRRFADAIKLTIMLD